MLPIQTFMLLSVTAMPSESVRPKTTTRSTTIVLPMSTVIHAPGTLASAAGLLRK